MNHLTICYRVHENQPYFHGRKRTIYRPEARICQNFLFGFEIRLARTFGKVKAACKFGDEIHFPKMRIEKIKLH